MWEYIFLIMVLSSHLYLIDDEIYNNKSIIKKSVHIMGPALFYQNHGSFQCLVFEMTESKNAHVTDYFCCISSTSNSVKL